MRPDELERRLQDRLDALGPAPRAELLHLDLLACRESGGQDSLVDDQARRLNEYTRYVADSLKRWVDEKWGADYHCPMCQLGFNAWATRGELPLPVFQSDPETLLPMICGNCGYTILIRRPRGILSREDFEDPEVRERLDKARQDQGDDSTA